MDIKQYEEMFLEESKENLSNMNKILLEIEKDGQDKQKIDELFRIAHTLKGMCSTMGYEMMTKITHFLEDKLQDVKNGAEFSSYLLDLSFKSLDLLEEQVDSILSSSSEKQIDLSEFLLEKSEEVKEITSFNWISKEEADRIHDLKATFDDDLNLFKIFVKIDENSMLKEARAFMVYKLLEDMGEILHMYPSVTELESFGLKDDLKLIFMSNVDMDQIKEKILNIMEIKETQISLFEKDSNQLETKASFITKEKSSELSSQEKTPVTNEKKSKKTVRVDIERLDLLMNTVSELIIIKTRMEEEKVSLVNNGLLDAVESLERITTSIHDLVTKIRMVPVSGVFSRFPRIVRDLAKSLDKEVNLEIFGEETEIDRGIIDEIADPLIHIIRNSLDHGLESPEKRLEKGKNKEGLIKISAYQEGNSAIIEISDDGDGINIEKVKQKAVENGLLTKEEATTITEHQAFNLIMLPGFSTADKISEISGRGVGLDAVREKIDSIGGTIDIISEKGIGTTFQIRLPLTLSIINSLMIEQDLNRYAIPLANISEIIKVETSNLQIISGDEVFIHRNEPLKVIRLSKVFNLNEKNEKELYLVIVKKANKRLAISVDKLVGNQEIVVKSIAEKQIKEVSGATILGNGNIALILDPLSFFD